MDTKTTVLAEVPSGRIELVNNGMFNIMQFNCSCEDALPYCGGACCGLRTGYGVIIQPSEAHKFQTVVHQEKLVLAHRVEDDCCVYHDGDGKCRLHKEGGPEAKPSGCRKWHCSPEGVGDGIVVRERGWMLVPMVMNAQ